MASDLSNPSKQGIQIIGLVATVMVVGIHYKSDVPDSPSLALATWNELLQEFWFGGVARVAVPLFSAIAGLLYFRSFDGSWGSYRQKLGQRSRTVLLPYFIVASVATVSWLLTQRLQRGGHELGVSEMLTRWLLRPPAEQLWFLRDLMVLVSIAPLISWLTGTDRRASVSLGVMGLIWLTQWQPFPSVGGWFLLQPETLLFFSVGSFLSRHLKWVNSLAHFKRSTVVVVALSWLVLVAARVGLRPDFDLWYTHDFGVTDLVLHQASIVVGCVAVSAFAVRLSSDRLRRLSGVSFFVFLVHEFPLRAAVDKVVERLGDWPTSCWVVAPCVVVACYAAGLGFSQTFPRAYAFLTGGRTPDQATRIATADPAASLKSDHFAERSSGRAPS